VLSSKREPHLHVVREDEHFVEVDLNEIEDGGRQLGAARWSEVMPSVSLIVPTWNEARNLPFVLPLIPSWVAEVILVDGGSTDSTREVAVELMPDIKVMGQPGVGKGDAMAAGFRAATGDIIAAIDADGSMDPVELHAMVGQLMCGADFVKGSRFAQGGGTVDMELHRKLGNWFLVMVTRILYGQRYSDLCYGYVAFWRQALDVLRPDAAGFEIEALLNARALRGRLVIAETPSFEARRIHGVSNLKAIRDGWRVLHTLIRERFTPSPELGAGDQTQDQLPLRPSSGSRGAVV
jgi:glycosyltransferase involved in cell wall biosynthesis